MFEGHSLSGRTYSIQKPEQTNKLLNLLLQYPSEMEGVPLKMAIPRLNRIMVQDSDYAIAYVAHSWGGAETTLGYAQQRERQGKLAILNLGKNAQ